MNYKSKRHKREQNKKEKNKLKLKGKPHQNKLNDHQERKLQILWIDF